MDRKAHNGRTRTFDRENIVSHGDDQSFSTSFSNTPMPVDECFMSPLRKSRKLIPFGNRHIVLSKIGENRFFKKIFFCETQNKEKSK